MNSWLNQKECLHQEYIFKNKLSRSWEPIVTQTQFIMTIHLRSKSKTIGESRVVLPVVSAYHHYWPTKLKQQSTQKRTICNYQPRNVPERKWTSCKYKVVAINILTNIIIDLLGIIVVPHCSGLLHPEWLTVSYL